MHPYIVFGVLGVAILSCVILGLSVNTLKSSLPPVSIQSVSNCSEELINYSIPYMISFWGMDLGNLNMLLSFVFFMLILCYLTLKTHKIFINPMLIIMGYNIYEVRYIRKDGSEGEDFFLVKGPRLQKNTDCRITQISEQLYLVTERNPEV